MFRFRDDFDHEHDLAEEIDEGEQPPAPHLAPGKRTLVQSRYRHVAAVGVRIDRFADGPAPAEADAEVGAGDPESLAEDQRRAALWDPFAMIERLSRGAGEPLAVAARRDLEAQTGADLSAVRVHTGPESAEAARVLGARAFTIGQDIHFAAGAHDVESPAGRRLLAHEVAHTIQQRGVAAPAPGTLEVSREGDASEVEAHAFADGFATGPSRGTRGAGSPVAGTVGRPVLARAPAPEGTAAPNSVGPRGGYEVDRARSLIGAAEVRLDEVSGARLSAYRAAVDRIDPYGVKDTIRALLAAVQTAARAVRDARVAATADPSLAPDRQAVRDEVLRRIAFVEGRLKNLVGLRGMVGPRVFRGQVVGALPPATETEPARVLAEAAVPVIRALAVVVDIRRRLGSEPAQAEADVKRACVARVQEASAHPGVGPFLHGVLSAEGLDVALDGVNSRWTGKSLRQHRAEIGDAGGGVPVTVAGVIMRVTEARAAFLDEDYPRAAGRLDEAMQGLRPIVARPLPEGAIDEARHYFEDARHATLTIDHLQRYVRMRSGGPGRAGMWDLHAGRLLTVQEALEMLAGERPYQASRIANAAANSRVIGDAAKTAIEAAILVTFGFELAAGRVGVMLATRAAPAFAREAGLVAHGLRAASAAVMSWAARNPATAADLAELAAATFLGIVDAGGVKKWSDSTVPQLPSKLTPEEFANFGLGLAAMVADLSPFIQDAFARQRGTGATDVDAGQDGAGRARGTRSSGGADDEPGPRPASRSARADSGGSPATTVPRRPRAPAAPGADWSAAKTELRAGRTPRLDLLPKTEGNAQGLRRLADIDADETIPPDVRAEFRRELAAVIDGMDNPPENLHDVLSSIVYSKAGRAKYQRRGMKLPSEKYVSKELGGLRRIISLRALFAKRGMVSLAFYERARRLDASLPGNYDELDWHNGAQRLVDLVKAGKLDFDPNRDLLPSGMVEGMHAGDSAWYFAGRDAEVSNVRATQTQLAVGGAYLDGYVVVELPSRLALPDPATGYGGASRPTALDLTNSPLGKLNSNLAEPVGRTNPQSHGQPTVREVVVPPLPISAMGGVIYVSAGGGT